MNMPTRNIFLIAAVTLAASCSIGGPTHDETISRTFPAAGVHRLDLREVNGSVDISAGPADSITLVAHVHARGQQPDARKDNKGYFETNLDGETLVVGRRNERRHVGFPFVFSTHNVSVDYDIHVPPQFDLELRTVNGRIATRGVDGETDAVTVNGAIDVESSGMRELRAHTVNGGLKARFMQTFQGANLKTVNGGVVAVLPPNASFACDLSQVNGDFEASFPLNIHSHPGSRRVSGEVNGGRYDLRIVTVNGDIRVENGAGTMAVPPPPAAPAGSTAMPAMPAPPAPPAPPHGSWGT
jgi:DUF4097 and DUF4098 domain-containing protein YvlB